MTSRNDKKQTITCPVCEIRCVGTDWEKHISGKKHQRNEDLCRREELNHKRTENGLFIAGFPQRAPKDSLFNFFQRFGEILEFYYNIEKHFVLATFKEKSVAEKLLKKNGVFYFGQRLRICKRKVFNDIEPGRRVEAEESSLPGIDHERVMALLTSGGTLNEVLKELMASEEEKAKYCEVLKDLKTLFGGRFPRCEIHSFGSTRTGLNVRGSDIDVFVEILQPKPTSSELSALPESKKLVRIGEKLMYRNKETFCKVRAITRAKTPIVKCVHRPTQVSCDISFKNRLAIMNSELIRYYLRLDSRVFPYFMMIRYWALKNKFSGCGKMSNYALVTIAAIYLQQLDPPVLPTVHRLQQLCSEEQRIDGWLCSYCTDPSAVEPSKNNASLFELLAGFFEFYHTFNVNDMVLCSLTATAIPKVLFLQPTNLPEPIRTDYLNLPEGKLGLRITTEMVVQDPFELTHNLTGSVGKVALKTFLAHCELATTIMQEALQHPEDKRLPFLNDLFNRKPKMPKNLCNRRFCITGSRMEMTYLADKILGIGFLLGNTDEGSAKALTPGVNFERCAGLAYKLVLRFFESILKLEVHQETPGQSTAKVQKLDTPSDVHNSQSINQSERRFLYCKGNYRLWEGRKKVQKNVSVGSNSDCFKTEEMITAMMHAPSSKQDSTPAPLVSLTCDFHPISEPPSIKFTFEDKGCQKKVFVSLMMFIQTRLPYLINKYVEYLKHQSKSVEQFNVLLAGENSQTSKESSKG